MTPDEALAYLRAATVLDPLPKSGRTSWAAAAVSITVDDHDEAALSARIDAAAGAGWLELTDRVLYRRAGEDWRCPLGIHAGENGMPEGARLLSGEIAEAGDTGLFFRHRGRGLWRCHTVIEGQGEPVLARGEQRLTVLRDRAMRYRTYWSVEERRIIGARLIGFTAMEATTP